MKIMKQITLRKKIDMLKKVFFLSSLNIDLSDLQSYEYLEHMICFTIIVKKKDHRDSCQIFVFTNLDRQVSWVYQESISESKKHVKKVF